MGRRKRSRNKGGKRHKRRSQVKKPPEKHSTPRGVKVEHKTWDQRREPFSQETTLEDAAGYMFVTKKVDPMNRRKRAGLPPR